MTAVLNPSSSSVNRTPTCNWNKLLNNKVALITGAEGAIGREIALECARQGAIIEIADMNQAEGDKTQEIITKDVAGSKSVFTKVNVSVELEVKTWIEGVAQRHGKIDILVNNAAIWVFGVIADITSEDWDKIMGVNIKGYAFCMKHVLPHMVRRNSGSIVNVASISSVIAQSEMVAYNTTKGAVLQMTRCTALDYGKNLIRVNAVCPGFIDSPISRKHAETLGLTWEQFVANMTAEYFIPRPGTPHDVAMAVVFLGSDESAFTTGSTLSVDGGYTAK